MSKQGRSGLSSSEYGTSDQGRPKQAHPVIVSWRYVMLVTLLVFSTSSLAQTRGVLIDIRTPTGTSDDFREPMPDKHSMTEPSSPNSKAQTAGDDKNAAVMPAPKPEPPILIRVTGYGVYDAKAKHKQASKRLKAIRASRLDAYRNLAERVYGLSLSGSSKVKDFDLMHDEFAAQVDTVVRGARVVSISENPMTGMETVLELELPADFKRCLNRVNNFRYRMDCLRPITNTSLMQQTDLAKRAERGEPDNRMRTLYHLK